MEEIIDPKSAYASVLKEIKKIIAGNEDVIKLMFISLVADGNALLEGVPGVAKTTMAKALAQTINADFKRIQGTPDLEIKDIVGYSYLDDKSNIRIKRGAIFTNILLMDELNRAPPKTTTAFLEALEERQVTISDQTIALPRPFLALATQNPLSIEGTTPLPKVLADRFMIRIGVTYANEEQEIEMLKIKENDTEITINKVIDKEDIIKMQAMTRSIRVSSDIEKRIAKIVEATRKDMHIVMGGSPRAEISFLQCGRAKALIEGRSEVTKDDIKFLARPVLSHRLTVRSTGGIGVNGVIDGIMATIGV